MGLFDTVISVRKSKLYDIGLSSRVYHVRHALALFERRNSFRPERYSLGQKFGNDQTVQEAWFIGSHGNIGGGCEQDGLALWPLHWIVTEAVRYGLGLGFQQDPENMIIDPSSLIFPRGETNRREISCANGIRVSVEDLSSIMNKLGFNAHVQAGMEMLECFQQTGQYSKRTS